ncbi:hypothetical protein FH972_006419 [Carpinus fangiana]|uniref:AMP-dependent synthetase/ligase domain-containing protein n=1 Tax=Carpinus fangiana TaxID=176857 RepID=A0A5N6QS89_9ROSI|nr:hypothetical protein FH972_006419 [Carpinus fangiana]
MLSPSPISFSAVNLVQVPILYFSLLSLGVVISPANPISTDSEISWLVRLCNPVIAFATSSPAHKLPTFRFKTILLDSPEFDSMTIIPAQKLDRVEVSQSDLAAIMYSFGTTGKVKGATRTMSVSLPPPSTTRTTRRPTPFGRPSTSAWTRGGRTGGKPDTLLEKARQEKEHVTALDPKNRSASGTETPWSQTPVTDLTAVGEGRGTVLSLKLDRLSDSVSGQTVVDPKGYLTDLKSMKITSDAEISDGWVRLAEKRKPWMKGTRTETRRRGENAKVYGAYGVGDGYGLLGAIFEERQGNKTHHPSTLTGILLAGVGNVDLRRKTNYLIVDSIPAWSVTLCKYLLWCLLKVDTSSLQTK